MRNFSELEKLIEQPQAFTLTRDELTNLIDAIRMLKADLAIRMEEATASAQREQAAVKRERAAIGVAIEVARRMVLTARRVVFEKGSPKDRREWDKGLEQLFPYLKALNIIAQGPDQFPNPISVLRPSDELRAVVEEMRELVEGAKPQTAKEITRK